jgi:hypothetical protein
MERYSGVLVMAMRAPSGFGGLGASLAGACGWGRKAGGGCSSIKSSDGADMSMEEWGSSEQPAGWVSGVARLQAVQKGGRGGSRRCALRQLGIHQY